MTVLYNRRSLCMGDDVYNGIYRITMPEDADLESLIGVLLHGGCGNDWPIPQTSVIGWTVYSDAGRLAEISADEKQVTYLLPKDTKLSDMGIRWVFGERTGTEPDNSALERLFTHL